MQVPRTQAVLVPAADPALIEIMRSARGVPFFICSPTKTGRTSLALDYAQREHGLDEVLWMDAAADGFGEAVKAGTMFEHIGQQILSGLAGYRLIVFDDLPALDERAAALFSAWIDQMIEEQVEVIVITTPHEDCLANHQSDRLLIDGPRLVASQSWSRERMATTLASFFDEPLPSESLTLAALMLLMGRGIVDNLRSLGYQIPAGTHAQLRKYCPLITIDEVTGFFDAVGCPVTPLKQRLLVLLNEAAREKDESNMPELERSFERLTQLSLHLFERAERERSQLLLELAGGLLAYDDAGYPVNTAEQPFELSGQGRQGQRQLEEEAPQGAQPVTLRVVQHPAPPATLHLAQPLTPSATLQEEQPSAQPATLTIRLFGDFEILRGNVRIESAQLHRRKVRELLVHLALNLGRPITRETVMERLWPDKDLPHAKDNFYTTWSRLNRALSDGEGLCPYLSNGRGLCRLDTAFVTTDVHEFEKLSRAVLFEQGSAEQCIDAMYRLEQLYRGDILSGYLIDPFVQAAQTRYRSILVDVMLEASKIFSQLGNDTNAVWFARKAFDTDPTREDVYRILMAMQDKAGQRTSALRTYFDCKRFLSEELGIMPSQKTTALYQDLVLDRR